MSAQYDIWVLVDGEWELYRHFEENYFEEEPKYTYTEAVVEAKNVSNDTGYVFAIGINENEPVGEVIFLNGDLFLMQKDNSNVDQDQ